MASTHRKGRVKKVAVVAQATKLPGEKQGLDRTAYVAETLAAAGYDVTLYTSNFQHWEKTFRETWKKQYRVLPYRVMFVSEPGYSKNIDPRRVYSHSKLAKGLAKALRAVPNGYDLIYCLMPPNDLAAACARYAEERDIPFVVDVSDLWPDAMHMAFDVPIVSDLAFLPFTLDAKAAFKRADAVVGTSDEYAAKGAGLNPAAEHVTVYVGNDLSRFDEATSDCRSVPSKGRDETWVSYAGTLGKSYDIETLIDAAVKAEPLVEGRLRVKILGDGPDMARLVERAKDEKAPVDFLGYLSYADMCRYLCESDILVNSLVKDAPQSIVSKVADYLAAGKPMINTGTSPEFCSKVEGEGFGVNVDPQDVDALAAMIVALSEDECAREAMGERARRSAEGQFDRAAAYTKITELVDRLVG